MSARLKSRFLVVSTSVVTSLLLASTAAAGVPFGFRFFLPHRESYERGAKVFFGETFGGNGRTCATCHDPRTEFTVSPDLVQQRYLLDANDPLFRTLDSDDGAGRDYTTVLTHAVFRVTIPLHPNVTRLDQPSRRTITVWRGVPSIDNVELTAPYLQDGRASSLPLQARGAITDHMQPRRKPLNDELDALETFMSEQFYPSRLRSLTDTTDPLPKTPGFSVPVESDAALRGQASFDLHCRRCHGGELGDRPDDPTLRFSNVFVSERDRPGFPLFNLAFKQPDGSVQVAETPDPGRAALTGKLDDLNAFDVPSLRGLKHTAPYFHDNSAKTLRDVIMHYNLEMNFRIAADEMDDLIAYLELL